MPGTAQGRTKVGLKTGVVQGSRPQHRAHTGRRLKVYFFFLINLFILFLAALGLPCCTQAFSSCSEQGLPFVAMRGLLIAVASLVAAHGL